MSVHMRNQRSRRGIQDEGFQVVVHAASSSLDTCGNTAHVSMPCVRLAVSIMHWHARCHGWCGLFRLSAVLCRAGPCFDCAMLYCAMFHWAVNGRLPVWASFCASHTFVQLCVDTCIRPGNCKYTCARVHLQALSVGEKTLAIQAVWCYLRRVNPYKRRKHIE